MNSTNLFVFGDSLSDTGNLFTLTGGLVPPAPFYFKGRFSNGPLAVEYLAAQSSLNLTLNSSNNFAVAGATTGQGNSLSSSFNINLPGLQTQLNAFSAKVGPSGADRNGLYIVWAGPNDFLDFLQGKNVADPAVLIGQGSLNLAKSATTLSSLGAQNIVLPNMINLGRLPLSKNFQAEGTAITKAFNAKVALELDSLDFSVTKVDLFSTGEAIAKDPEKFGFSNITDPLLPLQFSPNPPSNPQGYLFWDELHPTTQGHAALANTIDRTLTGTIPQPSFHKINGNNANNSIVGTSENDDIRGFVGNDILKGGKGDDRIQGGADKDLLYGELGDDILSGGDGNDSLWGGIGNDIAFGGDGNDLLYGQAGDDIAIGDGGNDTIYGGAGNDYLLGGEGQDSLWGNEGKDILNGGLGQDLLFGGGGGDRLDGGADDDSLTGGQGKDLFVFRLGNGKDIVTDFQVGQDKIDLTSFGFANYSNFIANASLVNDIISFGPGNTLELLNTNVLSLSAADFILA
jgi:phospholipase/lecithinase/hemolysin